MTITRTITGDTAASVTLLTLRDATNGAAIAVSPALPQPFADAGGGVWNYAFTEPAGGITYAYGYRVTWGDGTFDEAEDTKIGTALAAGYYCSQVDIQLFYGDSADIDSDINNTLGTANAAKYQQVLDVTDGWINRQLRAAGYVYPLPTTSAEFDAVADIAPDYARALLHMARGALATDANGRGIAGQMSRIMDDAEKRLGEMLSGQAIFDCPAALGESGPSAADPTLTYEPYGTRRVPYQYGYGYPFIG